MLNGFVANLQTLVGYCWRKQIKMFFYVKRSFSF